MEWVKSSYGAQNGNCVEVGAAVFRKSSFTQPNACVEASDGSCGMVHVRDSKDPEGAVLDYPAASWDGGRAVVFVPVSAGQVPASLVAVRDSREGRDDHWFSVTRGLGRLWFDQSEADAFRSGVADGQFVSA
jgi:hypothetical protein